MEPAVRELQDATQILGTRTYKKWGYQLIHYMTTGHGLTHKPFDMCSAFTYPAGEYIGNSKNAYRLCAKRGIKPERIPEPPRPPMTKTEEAKKLLKEGDYDHMYPCSIGFCERENKWYGWSHRAIYGFTIGSEVKKGHCAYTPTGPQDMLDDMIRFWVEDGTILKQAIGVPDPHSQRGGLGVLLEYESKAKSGKGCTHINWEPYLDPWGKGEWTAKTMEDAKEMAIAFAKSVS